MKKINISTNTLSVISIALSIGGAIVNNVLTERNIKEIAKKEVEELLKNK